MILLASLVMVGAFVLGSVRCPVELKLESVEPGGIMEGKDVWLVTLAVTNRCFRPIIISEEGTVGEGRVADRWIQTKSVVTPRSIPPMRPSVIQLFVPEGSDVCRVRLQYQYLHRSLQQALGIGAWQAPSRLALRIQQAVKWISPWLFQHIWRANARPPDFWHSRWHRVTTAEIVLPREVASR